MQVKPTAIQHLRERVDFPKCDRPQEEQEQALDILVAANETPAEALQDFRFLNRPGHDLAGSARRLVEFEALLENEEQARLALTALEARPRTPVIEKAFQRSLDLTRDVPLTVELVALMERNQQLGEGLLSTLEQVAEVASGKNLAPLMSAWLKAPPEPRALEAARKLAAQVRQPGFNPEGSWGVELDRARGPVWASDATGQSSYSKMKTESISLAGLIDCKLHFEEAHQFAGLSKCDIAVCEPGKSDVTLAELGGSNNWTPREYDLSAFNGHSVELKFDRRGGGSEGQVQLDDVRISGLKFDLSQPVAILAPTQGSWGQKQGTNYEGQVWTESPSGNYQAKMDESLYCKPFSLAGIQHPSLTFDCQYRTESGDDQLRVEVREPQGEWVELQALSGHGNWGSQSVDLSDFADREVEVRFRFTSDDSWQRDGVELANVKVNGLSPQGSMERVFVEIDGHGEDRRQEDKLVDFLLAQGSQHRVEAYEALAQLTESTKNVRAALELFPAIEDQLQADTLDQQLESLRVLWPKFKLKAPEVHAQVLKDLAPGEDVIPSARLMVEVGESNYPLLRRRLTAADETPEQRSASLEFYTSVHSEKKLEESEQAFLLASIPVGRESLGERREMMAQLVELHHGDLETALPSWRALTRWLVPQETLSESFHAYRQLYAALGEDKALALEAIEFVREHQLGGILAERSMEDCVTELSHTLLSSPEKLQQALNGLLIDDSDLEIDIDEEGVNIGDIWLERGEYFLH